MGACVCVRVCKRTKLRKSYVPDSFGELKVYSLAGVEEQAKRLGTDRWRSVEGELMGATVIVCLFVVLSSDGCVCSCVVGDE